MKKNTVLYIVIPCYNEEEVLNYTNTELTKKINNLIKNKIISNKSRIMYVNDGSKDNTWNLIKKYHDNLNLVTGINLSKNMGHQNALLAGLMTAKEYADIVISMDADLQDDINIIDEMIKKYNQGFDIIYGVRSVRKKDTLFKRFTAQSFYKLMKHMGVDIIYNHADYRLTSKIVLNELENYKETNLFLRGIFPMIGFESDIVYYERNKRLAGKSKYSIKKMFSFAWEGITSLTNKPLKLIRNLGLIISLLSFIYLIYTIIGYFSGNTISGWATIIVLICFFSGIQILCIGIIGEYLGKVYIESKKRPRYCIKEKLIS